MLLRLNRRGVSIGLSIALAGGLASPALHAAEESGRRQIEEVVVTAERQEATVSDTSIAITAFTGEMIEDFGLRNQEDLQNYIPAAVIEPYDMAIRGIGRNFRALGGDPGVATYLNDVYSEDFGIASTEGGLFDIDRIEVLRGPQGTLYGRNAIGGAINFVNKKPTQEFEGEARAIIGDYDLQETYGMLSFPVIEDILAARIVGTKRERDGYHRDISGNPDVHNYGDENYALSLLFTPTDNLEVIMRGNERSYRRRVGNQGGSLVFNEAGGVPDEITGFTRNTTALARGYREVNPAIPCASATSRAAGGNCIIAGQPTFNFTRPNGTPIVAQRVTPGIDQANTDRYNRLLGHGLQAVISDLEDIQSGDLKTDTNGLSDEFFDHQAFSMTTEWTLDPVTVKYIFGYTDYFYDRTTDEDLSSSAFQDRQFYVSQETEYVSHELQFFYDLFDNFSVTSGLFYYDAKISQRGDFYDSVGNPQFTRSASYGPVLGPVFLNPTTGLFATLGRVTPTTWLQLPGAELGTAHQYYDANISTLDRDATVAVFGPWVGDTGGAGSRIHHGPITAGTDTEYQTRTEREAFAVYTQSVWQMTDRFALTTGLRWALDRVDGYESAFFYDESLLFPLTSNPATSPLALNLATYNFLARLDPNEPVRLVGVPTSASLWRQRELEDEGLTWRVNLDFEPNDDTLLYASVTTGHRSAGMNLALFSSQAEYEGEDLMAYELGYKGSMFDSTLQVNGSVYYYDYEEIHSVVDVPSALSANGTSSSVLPIPGAEILGVEVDGIWLATDALTLGANFSYTPSEYTESFFVIDNYDPFLPQSLVASVDRQIDVDGNQLPRVPEMKGGAWGSYVFDFGSSGSFETLLTFTWIDDVYFSVFEQEEDKAPAYSRWDIRGTWSSSDEAWMVAAFVNNVLDEIGVRQIDRGTEDDNWLRKGAVTDPRLYGLELRYRFGAL